MPGFANAIRPAVLILSLVWCFQVGLTQRELTTPVLSRLMLGIVSVASFAQVLPWADAHHIFWAISPAIGLLVPVLLVSTRREIMPWAAACVLGALYAGAFFYSARIASFRLRGTEANGMRYVRLEEPAVLAGISVLEPEAKQWAQVTKVVKDYVAGHPNGTALVSGIFPLYATLVPNLKNAGMHFTFVDQYPREVWFAEWPKFIEATEPLVFVMNDTLPTHLRELLLRRHYAIALALPALKMEVFAPGVGSGGAAN